MRFHWTKEPWGYALRDSNNRARATMISGKPPHAQGFYGQVIDAGMPESGPYKSRAECAEWVAQYFLREVAQPGDSLEVFNL